MPATSSEICDNRGFLGEYAISGNRALLSGNRRLVAGNRALVSGNRALNETYVSRVRRGVSKQGTLKSASKMSGLFSGRATVCLNPNWTKHLTYF